MEGKKITPEQLQQLFAFTRQHFVEYYDLQSELADHLANAIEERWQQQPGLTFSEALQLEFKKFGIFGFSDIVEQRQNALFKKYYRLVWKEFRQAFNFQMIVLMAFAALSIYGGLLFIPRSYPVLLLLFLSISVVKLWQLKKQYRKKLEQTGRKWLLEEIIFSCGGFGIMMALPMQLSQFIWNTALSPMSAGFMAIVFSLLFIYDYIVLFRIPSHAGRYLQKAYPEYGMEKIT